MAALDAGPGDDAAHDVGADAPEPEPPRVVTPSGEVIGTTGLGYEAFLGIPYALPPTGERRFALPQSHPGWDEPLDASSAPPRCVQHPLGFDLESQEDCLFLNVHVPAPRPERAPVVVWIHGGAFIFGEGLQTDGGTAGDILARDHGVIVVSINYRLGPFGFLAHPSLADEGEPAGNWGMADQQLALRWVRDHIASFGGDPDDVTIAGESAGGISVCLHMVMPESAGLFHKAISQSGPCDGREPTLDDAEALANEYVSALGCAEAGDIPACLRELTQQELMDADPGAEVITSLTETPGWWPHIDGVRIPTTMRAAAAADALHRVPSLFGWNADEGTLFVMLAEQAEDRDASEADYMEVTQLIADGFGVDVAALRAQYPLADYPDPGAALAAAIGHSGLACPARRGTLLLGEGTTWSYRFTFPDAPFQLGATRELGAYHGGEIQYVFGHPSQVGRRRFAGEDLALHETMAAYWTNFIRTGDPNGEGLPTWPPFEGDQHLVLDREITTGTASDADVCAFWEPAAE